MKTMILTLMLLLAAGLTALAIADVGDEGFELPETMFTYVDRNVSHVVNATDAAHSGAASFRVNPSGCGANCFFNYRVDLTHTFEHEPPVYLIGVSLWALEGSSSGSGWGGKIRIGHDDVWNFFDSGYDWWGVIGNGHPITGEWMYNYISIGEVATNVNIQLWDITNRSTLWLDDVVLYYMVDGTVRAESASWSSVRELFVD